MSNIDMNYEASVLEKVKRKIKDLHEVDDDKETRKKPFLEIIRTEQKRSQPIRRKK